MHVYSVSQVTPSFQPQILRTKTKMTLKLSKTKPNVYYLPPGSSGKERSKKAKQLFISTNRYAPIAMNDNMELKTNTQSPATNSNMEQEKKISLPPPIIVRGIKDFISVRAELIDIVGPENFSVKATINTLKIQPSSPEVIEKLYIF